ncbi:MAG TPA: hypothetical protein VF420_13355 [Casimicrobiaceae bacterium]
MRRADADKAARKSLAVQKRETARLLKALGGELEKEIRTSIEATLVGFGAALTGPEWAPAREDEVLPTKEQIDDLVTPVTEAFSDAFNYLREQFSDELVQSIDEWLEADADVDYGEDDEDADEEE